MDPIECALVNGSDYCWVQGSAGEKGTETAYFGAYLFPIIQHYDKATFFSLHTRVHARERHDKTK